jgi:rhodanese-related sulfurtransferase
MGTDSLRPGATPISRAHLAKTLRDQNAPIIYDVRRSAAFDSANRLIAGAVRLSPDSIDTAYIHFPKDRQIVVYCVHGHEVSQNVAIALKALNFDAVFLEGGITAWEAEGLPTMPKNFEPMP